tara:strand:+ start:635 stop:778 length:144 start_codon:yes stop_codon:yes gene_type:complete
VYAYPIEQRITGLGKGETEIICLLVRVIVMSYKPEEEKDLEEEDYDC